MATSVTGSSGSLDVAGIVTALVNIERGPITRVQNDIIAQQQKLSSWNTVEASVVSLRSKLATLMDTTSWTQMSVGITQSETMMSATATSTAADSSYDVHVSTLAKSFRGYGDAQASSTAALGFAGDFYLQGSAAENKISVAAGDSLNAIAGKINTASDAFSDSTKKVRASVVANKLVLETVSKGAATGITLTDGVGGVPPVLLAGQLGVLDGAGLFKNATQAGTDLDMTVNGVPVLRQTNTGITDVLAGVTLNFTKAGDASLTVAPDTASTKALIQSFVDAYNSTMTTIKKQSTATVGTDGKVSSSGVLQGESLLASVYSGSRALISATAGTDPDISTAFDSLRKIGITTVKGGDNQLTIDSTKLTAALRDHGDEVQALFRDPEAGLLTKFDAYLKTVGDPTSGTIQHREDAINTTIASRNKTIDTMNRRLTSYESQLYDQYYRLQSTLDSMNKQLAQLGSLGFGG